MFEMFLIMLATAAQAPVVGAGSVSSGSTIVAAPTPAPAPPVSQEESAGESSTTQSAASVAPPAFLAPVPAPDKTVAAPIFLAPEKKALQAEPQVPTGKFTTATEVKPILTATRGNWINVREFDGKDLLYVTQIWSWRCGLLELRVGINGNTPEPWPLPDCHMEQPMPSAILESDGVPYREFGPGSIAMVEIQITYDDLSTDKAKFNRQGVQIP